MGAVVRILHLDDSVLDGRLVAEELRMQGFACALTFVQTRADYIGALEAGCFDVILADYRVPGLANDEVFCLARQKCPEVPFIVVTGELGEERAVEAVKRGVTDYVIKDHLFRLVPAITRALAEAEHRLKRKRAEEQLAFADQRFHRILESLTDAFILLDKDFRIIYINPEAARINKKPPEAFLGRSHWEEWPASVGTLVEERYRHAMCERVPVHFEHHYVGGEHDVWLDIHAYPMDDGLAVLYRDISDRKQAEKRLLDSEASFRTMVARSAEPMVLLDDSATVICVSSVAARLLGFDPEELEGSSAMRLIDPADRLSLVLHYQDMRKNAPLPATAALRVCTKGGAGVWISATATFENYGRVPEKYLVKFEVLPLPKTRPWLSPA